MADRVIVNTERISEKPWGEVDKGALGRRLAELYAEGGITKAQIREVYAYVPDDAFGEDANGRPTFAYTKAWGPHHELIGNSIVLNRNGVHALAAALAGARAEPSLSGAALGQAKAHARKHYRALKEEPPEGIRESQKHSGQKRLIEAVGTAHLVEAADGDGKPRRIKAIGITADVINENGRRYPAAVLRAAVEHAKTHLHESLGQGRAIPLLGEVDHPSEKSGRPSLIETVVKWEDIGFDGKQVLLEGRVLETTKGRDILALMEGGVMPGVSQRGYGTVRVLDENGQRIEEVTGLTITGYDLVLAPSDPEARITILESEESTMGPEEILQMLHESGFFDELSANVRKQVEEAMRGQDAAQKEKALRSALGIGPQDDINDAVLALVRERRQPEGRLEEKLREWLGLNDTDDLEESLQARLARLARLEEAEQERQVQAYIEEQAKAIAYPEWLRKQFLEAVLAAKPKSEEEARRILVEKRKEYDGIMAGLELAAKGYPGLRALAPVLERETGTPEFARAAYLLTESMIRAGAATPRKWNRPLDEMSPGERFAKRALERFDELYGRYLLEESRQFEEAEQTADLALPYSVARTIVAEAVPKLVAASIFDVGTTDQAPTRIYYEHYAEEPGASASVTDEEVTLTQLGVWYPLAHKRLRPGTVTVTEDVSGTPQTRVEGTDYAIDYPNGRICGLGGDLAAGDTVKVDYTYDATRKGEMEPIERAKLTLAYKTLEIAADRLATDISTEAVVFARSQLGWDATARTLAGLTRKIQELIDSGMMSLGLGAALSVPNNIAGTWSATVPQGQTYDEHLDELFRYIGVAKTKVASRHYEPTFILVSVVTGDLLSNSKMFTAAGARPDVDLSAAGYVGRIKGLPVFQSALFSDDWILVGNRELVFYRVFRPLVLKGPYPSYSSGGKLIASEQYYAEEFNGTDAPVPEKGSVVKLTS